MNYEAKARIALKNLENNTAICAENHEALKRYLKQYDVSPARKAIFAKHITKFLEHFQPVTDLLDYNLHNPDLKILQQNKERARDAINNRFAALKNSLSPSYLETVVNVSNAFMRWLNDGVKPSCMKDVKSSRSRQTRSSLNSMTHIQPAEERPKMLKAALTVQDKALVALMLEWGMRPEELVHLRYKDVSITTKEHVDDADLITIQVTTGKTGARPVVYHQAYPYLKAWYDQHPTKEPDSPFFPNQRNHKKRVNQEALSRRVKLIGRRAGIDKPCDLYALRHSSGFRAKLENENPEHAAAMLGHTMEYFEKTYGRITEAGDRARQRRASLKSKADDTSKSKVCAFCGHTNDFQADFCGRCQKPLTLTAAKESIDKSTALQQQLDDMNKKILVMQELMKQKMK